MIFRMKLPRPVPPLSILRPAGKIPDIKSPGEVRLDFFVT